MSKPVEDEVSRVLSNGEILWTTRSKVVALFASRDLNAGDAPVNELSDCSESRPNEAPVGTTILDLKYVSAAETRAKDVQQLNHGPDVDQEID